MQPPLSSEWWVPRVALARGYLIWCCHVCPLLLAQVPAQLQIMCRTMLKSCRVIYAVYIKENPILHTQSQCSVCNKLWIIHHYIYLKHLVFQIDDCTLSNVWLIHLHIDVSCLWRKYEACAWFSIYTVLLLIRLYVVSWQGINTFQWSLHLNQ